MAVVLLCVMISKGPVEKSRHMVQRPPARAKTLFTVIMSKDLNVGRTACWRKYVELARRLLPLRTWQQYMPITVGVPRRFDPRRFDPRKQTVYDV